MKKIISISFLFIGVFLFVPLVSNAQSQPTCSEQCVDDTDFSGCMSACVEAQNSGGSGGGGGGFSLNCSNMGELGGMFECAISIMDALIVLLVSFGALLVIYGAIRFIGAEGEDRKRWKDVMVYGIVALAIILSIWGLVGILRTIFGVNNASTVDVPSVSGGLISN